jgi:GT2 family glycosyltransferase/SAM-dependent methyltransferase
MSKGSEALSGGLSTTKDAERSTNAAGDRTFIMRVPVATEAADFTGERFVPGLSGEIELEHLHRYLFAAAHAGGLDVLDIASGEGYGSYMLSQVARSVVGVDIDAEAVANAARRYQESNLAYQRGECTALPLLNDSVDLVVSFETLEHIAEHDAFMAELKRVLRPGGLLIMSSPEREAYGSYRQGDNRFHVKELNRFEFESLLKRNFKNVAIGAQRNLFGSLISGSDFGPTSAILVKKGELISQPPELPACPYLIAVSSDDALPRLGTSVFDGGMSPYIVSAIHGGIKERDGEIVRLRRMVGEAYTELLNLKHSARADKDEILRLRRAVREACTDTPKREASTRDGEGGLVEAPLLDIRVQGKNIFSQLAYRNVFAPWLPAGKVLRFLDRIYRRLVGRSLVRLENYQFDPAFFAAWNPDASSDPAVAFRDYQENWAPLPRIAFSGGELERLEQTISEVAQSSANLCLNSGSKPSISIVVPVYNNLRMTLHCIRSILRHGAEVPFEIIVVDDRSSEIVGAVLSSLKGIRYFRQTENRGFIAACNRGANESNGEYLVFLNNDTCVLPRWLDELRGTFGIRDRVGLVGSQLIYPNGVLQEAGGILWKDGSGWNYGRGGDRNAPGCNYLRPVDYCSGASIMIPRELFNELGQFDTHYAPAYAEDADLALKVRKAGYEVLYQPCSKVVHFEGLSSGTDLTRGVKSYQVLNLKKLFDRWQSELSSHGVSGFKPELERERGISKRVLFMDALTPTPDCDAGSLVIYQFMKIFLKLGYGVSFVPVDNLLPIQRYTESLQRMGVECWHHPHISSVEEYLETHGKKFDLVFLYRAPHAAKHLAAVRALAPQAKVVLNTVDLHFVREERQARVQGSRSRLKFASTVKEKELSVMRKTDATILLNQVEVELIGELVPSVKTFMLPLTQEVPGCRKGYHERKNLVFLGGFNHLPNVDAVKYFCAEIMPILRERLPGVKFLVVGSNPPAELFEYAREDVEIVGFVSNLDAIFDSCRVSVAPLRFGAGMKGKIVTSLSYGVPCVTTTIGSEGMALTPEVNILVGDSPTSFAAAVIESYSSQALWERLSTAGVHFARSNFSPEVVERKIQDMLSELRVSES